MITMTTKKKGKMQMNDLIQAVSSVGFPIVMCGVLCFYIFKIQTKLIESIDNNTKTISEIAIAINKLESEDKENE